MSVVPTDGMKIQTLDAMWQLYKHSHDVDYTTFSTKTKTKFREFSLIHDDDKVVGFCGCSWKTVKLSTGERVFAMYQGQTMLEKRLRKTGWSVYGPMILGLRGVARAKGKRVILWQDALTIRTFMLVAKNVPVYFPHPDRPMPDDLRELRDILGRDAYGDRYCAQSGIVKKDARIVTEENIHPDRMTNKHIRFYAEANPGYVHGDGLMQLTPLNTKILVAAGAQAAKTTLRRIRA